MKTLVHTESLPRSESYLLLCVVNLRCVSSICLSINSAVTRNISTPVEQVIKPICFSVHGNPQKEEVKIQITAAHNLLSLVLSPTACIID